jgi:hypothetical protein
MSDHSGLMLAARMTLAHFSVSSAMSFPNSAESPQSMCRPGQQKPVLHPRSGIDFLIELIDNRGRRAPWRSHTVPRACLIAWNEIVYRWDFRQRQNALRRTFRKCTQFAGLSQELLERLQ